LQEREDEEGDYGVFYAKYKLGMKQTHKSELLGSVREKV
jgi:hypothetical protein